VYNEYNDVLYCGSTELMTIHYILSGKLDYNITTERIITQSTVAKSGLTYAGERE
jgi:hypothetical protein